LIEPVLEAFEEEIAGVQFAQPRLALISSLSGRMADRSVLGGTGYWRRQMREPVRFADAIRTLAAQGVSCYVEMSPHPVLLGMASESVSGCQWLPSLRQGKDEWAAMFESLQSLHCSGAMVDWGGLDRGLSRRRIALPSYPFQRRRYWIDIAPPAPSIDSAAPSGRVSEVDSDAIPDLGSTDDALASVPAAATPIVDPREARLLELQGMLADERLERLREMVRAQVIKVLRLDGASPPAGRDRLTDLGMDSLMAVQLCEAINQSLPLGQPLSSTVMFDYPTIDAIAAHLAGRIAPAAPVRPAGKSASATPGLLDTAAVAALSDADIERLLDERLGVE
jgi:acyl transferase domain-containing protein